MQVTPHAQRHRRPKSDAAAASSALGGLQELRDMHLSGDSELIAKDPFVLEQKPLVAPEQELCDDETRRRKTFSPEF